MGWESSGVVGFDLGPLLQGQTRIAKVKSAYNSLIIDPRGLQCKTNSYEISGFGELSFRWIQICISSPMRRSSLTWLILPHRLQY